ncbi:hypothetical protein K438DRAFT_1599940 [Mycena galopus ATCC 62051]|nr:hypothetical protein K438DRAFT_1599940 [Mycena galopus ATCC 62051]
MLALLQHALQLAPTATKYAAIALLILNAGSFPLVWHARVMSVVFELRAAQLWHRITHFYLGKEKKRQALTAWYEAHLPIGEHPFRAEWSYDRRVGFDDSDFNLHMSNSSYAKALDSARFRIALGTFPNVFRAGGGCPLAATHFYFIREIPMLSAYQVRVSIGAWDSKWIWYICRFVKPPSKNAKSGKTKTQNQENGIASGLAIASGVAAAAGQGKETFIPALTTPATPLDVSGSGTPLNGASGGANANGTTPDAVSRALLERAVRTTEPDGALLYTVSVSQLCYKQGRITIPPAIVLAANGFYAAPESAFTTSTSTTSTSSTDKKKIPVHPPHWPAVRTVTQSMRVLAKFYAGGWRDVPEGERWWEDAFAACEDERKRRLVPFVGSELENGGMVDARRSGLSGGLEGVRRMVTEV